MQLTVLQTELDIIKVENERLRGLVNEMNNNYHALHVQVGNLMQKLHDHKAGQTVEDKTVRN